MRGASDAGSSHDTVTVVAIHQPNYLPWLGYFAKIAAADVFVLLDDVQFSKGSYTNRVQISRNGAAGWLTVPIRHEFGALIKDIEIARADWSTAHRSILKQSYGGAAAFASVWPALEPWLAEAEGGLADINGALIRRIAQRLALRTRFLTSSQIGVTATAADERLAAIVSRIAPGGTYLSGQGGASYQSADVFAARQVRLAYSAFKPVPYARGDETFLPGLSIVDALFHLGWDETAALLRASR